MAINPEYRTYLNNEWNAGRLLRPGVALQQLRAEPRKFLRTYPIQNNYDPAASGVYQVHLFNGGGGHRPGTVLRTQNLHATQSFTLQGGIGQLGEGHPVWVHGLFTAAANAAAPIVWYRLDANGPDLMVTAKLTGCTFVARAVAGAPGSVDVAHIQPTVAENGVQLNNRLAATAGQLTYGRNSYDITSRSINVIGVRVGGQWKIYAQKLDKHHFAIRSVHRIFPA